MAVTRSKPTINLVDELGRLRATINASGDLLYDWDLAADAVIWTGRTDGIFGPTHQSVPQSGDGWNGRINPVDLPQRMRALSNHFAGNGDYDVEYRVRTEDGGFQWVHDRGSVDLSASGAPERMKGTLRAVNQRKQTEAQLEYLVNYDELTGHYNKLRLREALEQCMARAERAGRSGAFLVIGVDKLGMINTAYGYEAGDRVLVEAARCLDRCIRSSDVVGRLGSDRFGIVLDGRDEAEVDVVADRVLGSIRGMSIKVESQQLHVSASAGIASYPAVGQTSLDIISRAESALLAAKEKGRDCIHAYEMTEEQRRDYRVSVGIGEEVLEAIKENRLTLAYQPVVEAEGERVAFYECLLRMYAPDGTLVPAGRFIPVVEKLGLMRAIDRRVFHLVLDELTRTDGIELAFNISGLTVADRSWLRVVQSNLRERPDIAERIILEITETAALYDLEESVRFVEAMRELGCRIAIDDFGAGYTTFNHIKTLPVDIVKIDGSFVRDIGSTPDNQVFLRNLLSLARTLNLATVAECVETREDAEFLKSEGVDLLQGYLFGKPDIQRAWEMLDDAEDANGRDPQAAALMVRLPAAGQSQH